MKQSHRNILNKLEDYLNQPGAEHLRFWQALYGCGIIRGEMVDRENQIIIDDFNIKDEQLIKRIR